MGGKWGLAISIRCHWYGLKWRLGVEMFLAEAKSRAWNIPNIKGLDKMVVDCCIAFWKCLTLVGLITLTHYKSYHVFIWKETFKFFIQRTPSTRYPFLLLSLANLCLNERDNKGGVFGKASKVVSTKENNNFTKETHVSSNKKQIMDAYVKLKSISSISSQGPLGDKLGFHSPNEEEVQASMSIDPKWKLIMGYSWSRMMASWNHA